MLPTAGSQADRKSGSFQNMLSKYGLASSVTGSADGVNYNIAAAPLYFVRSGNVYLPGISGATFRYAGRSGLWWSSRASSTNASGTTMPSAYDLRFGPTVVSPSYGPWERWNGRPLRCLSTVLGMGGKV